MRAMDSIEADYERQIRIAMSEGDNDKAAWLTAGLAEYRKFFKTEADEGERRE